MAELDELDLKIVNQLYIDGRLSLTELGEKVGSSRQTVAKRLKQLMDEELIIVKAGLNLIKSGFKIANVGLEVKSDKNREEIEHYLRNCPRVVNIFRTPEKANLHLSVWGEDDQTINSTIESFRDRPNVDVVYTRYLGTPIHGNMIINVESSRNSETPCGMNCSDCHRYNNAWCVGCPASSHYRNPLQK
jgi:DNA-binding Lrp family transcriptional regulator